MQLNKLLENISFKLNFNSNPEISNLTCNSNEATKNCLFACLKGVNFDGHTFAKTALVRGACAILVEKNLNLPNQILVENSHLAYAQICANFFGNPAKQLKLIGITGTNGKTSISKTIKNLIFLQNKKVGLIGTIQNEINNEIIQTEITTPNHFEFQKLLRKMANENCEFVVMEVSSHALSQHRTGNTTFELGVFSNLTQDHLDYHKTMQAYYEAKKKLFFSCKVQLICTDCQFGLKLANELKAANKTTFTFSTNSARQADFTAQNIQLNSNNVVYNLVGNNFNEKIEFSTPGMFSVQNSMAAAISCNLLGFSSKQIATSIKLCKPIKGRSETIETNTPFSIICDYAHTPDGLLNILKSIKTYCEGRIITVFGCGGDRDAKKRSLMGEVAAQNSNFVIITSDNPRTENPEAIIEQISKGAEKFQTPFVKIVNRKEAIEFAVQNAKQGDVILLAGKGHEPYQLIGTEKLPFNEPEIVKQIVKNLKNKNNDQTGELQ